MLGMSANHSGHVACQSFDQSKTNEVRKLLKYLYADQILFAYRTVLQYKCNGCRIDHPSQSQHMCLEPLEAEIASVFYSEAEAIVYEKKHYLYLLFIETCNYLGLNYRRIDFDTNFAEYRQWWINTEFRDLEETVENSEDSYEVAVETAAMKLCSLEDRLTKC